LLVCTGNWWTPSSALDTDCEGKPVTAKTRLTQECIYEKKTAEIKARQGISEQNGRYKVEKVRLLPRPAPLLVASCAALTAFVHFVSFLQLEAAERQAAEQAALRAEKRAAAAAAQAKYAKKTMPQAAAR
jgi:hypothetical protein